jgi:CRISPR/Cas system CSM-associated protein Csm3 (group 7 of RAMP superfamily)
LNNESLVGKIIIKGKLTLESPLIIGSGIKEFIDIEVLKDKNGKPYIPATSLIGVLKHYFENNMSENIGDDSDYFWGMSEKIDSNTQKSIQSSFICHDLYSAGAKIRIRDGVCIDPENQTAKDKGKYDFEIVDKGAVFDVFLEVTLRRIYSKDTFKRILATIIEPLISSKIAIGAKTNSGFGKIALKNLEVIEFDFSKKDDVYRWLKKDFSHGISYLDPKQYVSYSKKIDVFSIEAKFALVNSIIIRAYSEKPDLPDAVNITSNGEFVLPGTSLKGAIRNRALKILKTIKIDGAEQKINQLFGITGENEGKENVKSRVQVEERAIKNAMPELQNRIKIDRFTGGTIKTALFNSMPLWGGNEPCESVIVNISIRNYKPWEAGLMLQVLKDIWCEDLAIGGEKNVGRGILKGISAFIRWQNKNQQEVELKIEAEEKGIIFLMKNSGETEKAIKELNEFGKSIQGVVA